MRRSLPAALFLGAATVAGFAPFGFYPLPVVTLALLFMLWQRNPSPRDTALLGFAWGLGFFLTGVSWVYVSLHDVGDMAAPLAGTATFLFCALLGVFPALAGYVFARFRCKTAWRNALLLAGAWTLAEWLRGWFLTGFPWLSIGYSQTPPSPLAGYAPLIGIYGVGLMAVLIAALLGLIWRRWATLLVVAAILAIGGGLRMVHWTTPVGASLRVSLLQGNIPQSLKWQPGLLQLSIDTYTQLAQDHPADLTVLPETAIPLFLEQIPGETLQQLTRHGPLLLGVPMRADGGYVNGAVVVAQGMSTALQQPAPGQVYAKSHLVPFGEYVPPGFTWFFDLVRIPMSDFSAGSPRQAPLAIAGQKVGPNICYEDLFGEELIHGLPEATLLVNLSNTAWFGHSLAQPQHLQIAQMRAMETGRPMLRATNTGMTAAIAPNGAVTAKLPPFVRDAVTVVITGYAGSTPYVRWGNGAVLILALMAMVAGTSLRYRRTA